MYLGMLRNEETMLVSERFSEGDIAKSSTMEEGVELDAAKCRDAARALLREMERHRKVVKDSANVMMSVVQIEAVAMR